MQNTIKENIYLLHAENNIVYKQCCVQNGKYLTTRKYLITSEWNWDICTATINWIIENDRKQKNNILNVIFANSRSAAIFAQA